MWKPSACIPTPSLTICSGSSTGPASARRSVWCAMRWAMIWATSARRTVGRVSRGRHRCYFDGCTAGGSWTINISSSGTRRRPPIQSRNYADSSTRLKNATPQTNGGCIHGGTVRLEGLKNRLEQLRPAPDQKGDDPQHKYAEGYKFAGRVVCWRKVEAIIVRIAGATGFDSCA
jgi:hypothetical protein